MKDINGIKLKVGDIVRFKMENQDRWIGDNEGEIIVCEGEFCIQCKNSGIITIGKGYDAYPGNIEKKESGL